MRVNRLKHALVLTHCLADGDAAGTACAIKLLFPCFEIGIPDAPTRTAKKIFSAMNTDYILEPDPENFEFVLVVDAAAPYMIGTLANRLKNAMILDHHSYNPEWEKFPYHTDQRMNSCSELVFEILKITGIAITQNIGRALIYGILSDTAQFTIAKPHALRTAAEIAELGVSIRDAMELLSERNIDISQRISIMKGFHRLKYTHYRDFLIAGTVVSAHEGTVCTSLVSVGVDIAFAGNQKENGFRISGRMSNNALKTGLTLPEIFGEVAEDVHLEAGGHEGAAGLSGTGDVEFAVNACMQVALQKLKEKL
ncbi:MAG: DHH family phosphoesterase [Thermoplasmata archaeon]